MEGRPVTRIAALLLGLAALAAHAKPLPAQAAPPSTDDDPGALIGDLVFHADLLAALDRLCAQAPRVDWHRPLTALLDQAFTPKLRELSRRLGADAGAQIVSARGGCRSRGFAAAYRESSQEYRALLERWRAQGE
jgi:hypothetical protein